MAEKVAAVRPLEWVGSSRSDLKKFPERVQDHVGFALYLAQIGQKHRDAKPLSGVGPRVMEIVSLSQFGTYRTVFTVVFAEAVYVLHAFQKKSKRGIATPKAEIDLVKQRLRAAEHHYRAVYAKG